MKIKQIFSAVLALALVFSLTGCFGGKEPENPDENPGGEMNDELVLYHNSTELSPALMALTEEYSKATGKKLSAKLGGNDFLGEIKSQNAAIYVVDTHSDLSDWHSGGLFTDLMNDSGFSSFLGNIPSGLQFNHSGIGSYGIPLMLEGYGYIFSKDTLASLFEGDVENLVDDLKTCSFTDFEGFVAAVDTYISAPSAAKVKVNENEYTFKAEKSAAAQNLTGVFSLNNENTRAAEHLLSMGLGAKFGSRYEVMSADESAVSGMGDILKAYMEVLDLHTSHIAGAKGSIGRGDEFTGGDYNYSTSVDLFARGLALFYPGGTSDAADFEKSSQGFGKNLDIIPMKLPLTDEQITASGMTAEKLQSSIVIGSRYYLAINPKADETSAAAAREFIRWLYEGEEGAKTYSSAFGAVPHNFGYLPENGTEQTPSTESSSQEPAVSSQPGTEENTSAPETRENSPAPPETESENSEGFAAPEAPTAPETAPPAANIPTHSIENSLMASVAEYYAAGNWVPDMFAYLPKDFAEEVLKGKLGDYFGMETWTDQNRSDFVDHIITGWKDLLDKDKTAVG